MARWRRGSTHFAEWMAVNRRSKSPRCMAGRDSNGWKSRRREPAISPPLPASRTSASATPSPTEKSRRRFPHCASTNPPSPCCSAPTIRPGPDAKESSSPRANCANGCFSNSGATSACGLRRPSSPTRFRSPAGANSLWRSLSKPCGAKDTS